MNPTPDHAELLQQLMDNISDNIFFKDRESRFIMVNRANAAFFGLTDPREAVGKDDFDYFDRDHAQRMREEEQRIMETGVPVVGEQQIGAGDQYLGWGSVTKTPLRDRQGRTIRTMGTGAFSNVPSSVYSYSSNEFRSMYPSPAERAGGG